MLAVRDAQQQILALCRPLPPETTPLSPSALGLVLAEDVASDLDSPPYDKSMVDGYAVRAADLATGSALLTVVEEVAAGTTPTRTVGPGQATRIMTGAPIPAGVGAVVMIECSRMVDGGRVQLDDRPPKPGQHIVRRASEMHEGDVVLTKGMILRPQELGVLATVGRTAVAAVPAPRVGVLSTGDEVVEANARPGPGQIRNSNGPMLIAQTCRAGGQPRYLGIARDRLDSLRPLVAEGLRSDVLILSGGVSAGKLDLVPGVLQDAGVVAHFHKVAMKPGKPVFFGTLPRGDVLPPTLVFGLPGNPVSSFVGFELFVRPALRRLRGLTDDGSAELSAALTEDFAYKTDRPTYHPAHVEATDSGWSVRPVPWFGSPDLRALTKANALVLFPAGDLTHRAGTRYPVYPLT
jgi:molybdopterin molybdotransferase